MQEEGAVMRRARNLKGNKRNDAYDMQAWWADVVARDPDGLGGVRSPRPLMPRACAAFSKA